MNEAPHTYCMCLLYALVCPLSLRCPLHADITVHVKIKSKDNSLCKGVTMGWKMISPKGTGTTLFCAFAWRSDCVFGFFRFARSHLLLFTVLLSQTNTCHRYDCDTCQLTYCRSSAADECVDEVLMFQTIRLPVLIGLRLFLGTVVICSRLLFVMMYGDSAQCVLL